MRDAASGFFAVFAVAAANFVGRFSAYADVFRASLDAFVVLAHFVVGAIRCRFVAAFYASVARFILDISRRRQIFALKIASVAGCIASQLSNSGIFCRFLALCRLVIARSDMAFIYIRVFAFDFAHCRGIACACAAEQRLQFGIVANECVFASFSQLRGCGISFVIERAAVYFGFGVAIPLTDCERLAILVVAALIVDMAIARSGFAFGVQIIAGVAADERAFGAAVIAAVHAVFDGAGRRCAVVPLGIIG